MSNTLSLATRLRSLSDEQLIATLESRQPSVSGVSDFFDLAEALLHPDCIQRCLRTLDRPRLAMLAALASKPAPDAAGHRITELAAALQLTPDGAREQARMLHNALLVDMQGDTVPVQTVRGYDAVLEQLAGWPAAGLPTLTELRETAEELREPVTAEQRDGADRLASELAFGIVAAVGEMLLELEREPARELAKGGLAMPDRKRLALAAGVDPARLESALALASAARLTSPEGGQLLASQHGNEWLLLSTEDRWGALADGWVSDLPVDLRTALTAHAEQHWGAALIRHLEWWYPGADDELLADIRQMLATAELLGVSASGVPSTAGAHVLNGRTTDATAAIARYLPPAVSTVYLQHDLSIVAPGPLEPAVDGRLRLIADAESRGLASTYRISGASINRALAAGENAKSILEFLRSISLTAIPQPLEYVVQEGAARYGLVRVGAAEPVEPDSPEHTAGSIIRTADPDLMGTIMVDQALAPLGLVRLGPTRAMSRHPQPATFWALSDARYPVAAEDAGGHVTVLRRQQLSRQEPAARPPGMAQLVRRLRAGADANPAHSEQAWLAKQLDAAARAKEAVRVTVRMPDDTTVDYDLAPASVAGGRLRARDLRSDVERTLPVAFIVAVTALG